MVINNIGFLNRIWDDPGPDRGWSWAILFATFLIRFCSHATQSFSTIMFPTIVASYEVDRETAAWPFTLRLTLRSFTAIVAAWLLKKYSIRKISHSYNFIQVIGYMVCYLGTYNIYWLHLGNGIINGIGVGLMDACTIVTLNEYFVNRRVMANGVMYTSTTLSAMVQPPLTMLLLHHYEIRGTFLCYSAWAAHCFIGGFLMRPRDEKHFPELKQPEDGSKDKVTIKERQRDNASEISSRKSQSCGVVCCCDGIKLRNREIIKTFCPNAQFDDNHLESMKICKNDGNANINGQNGYEIKTSNEFNNFENISLASKEETESEKETQQEYESFKSILSVTKDTESMNNNQKKNNIVREVCEVCCNPVAIVILVVSTLLLPLSQIYALIIMDHAELEGMSEERAVMVVPVLYISELLVRVPMSWIIEKDYIHKRHWYTIIMAILCSGFFAIAFTHNDFVLFSSSAMVGIYTCFMHCLRVVITVDYMGIETLAIMHGLVSFLNGCTYFLVPKVLGLLFSLNNNYKPMFLFLGGANLLAIILWQFVDIIYKRQRKNNFASKAKATFANS